MADLSITERRAPSRLAAFFAIVTLQDVVMLSYLAIILRLLWLAPDVPDRAYCELRVFACIAVVFLGCWAGRMPNVLPPKVRWLVYRVAIVGVIVENYLVLRELLPLLRPDHVDAALLHIDIVLFGVEPSLWMEQFNQRPIIEWFSFFYFSYFVICGAYLVAVVGFNRDKTTMSQFGVGTLLVYCGGQLGYILVPAYGPVKFLADSFHAPIQGGYFWNLVWEAVQAGSAMKDVFPSLHTAGPTWFALFAFTRARTDPRWRIPAIVTAFFAGNIIISTMLLRWHYAIDVVAGLALSFTVAYVTPRLIRWETGWRKGQGLVHAWDFGNETVTGRSLAEEAAGER